MPGFIGEILLDSLLDTLKMLPFLFAAYLLLEFIEHKSAVKLSQILSSGKLGIPGGALLGCVPQCGIGVASAHLFSAGIIGAGTLVAVFISTSDEALAVMLAHPDKLTLIVPLVLIKVAFAVLAGFIFDLCFRRVNVRGARLHNSDDGCEDCEEIKGLEHHHCAEECEHNIFISSLKRSGEVALFIFLVTAAMGFAIHFIGEERLTLFLQNSRGLQPLFSALVGLIPNCAASVVITELYISGSLSFGAVVAGLSTGAGIGYIALMRTNKHVGENALIIAYIFVFSTAVGSLIQLVS